MHTSIATVCLSGGLTQKLHACAAAGFDGVEIMDSDLTAAYESPEEIRALCARLGLRIEMFQPMRDVEGVDAETFADNLRRAEAKFEVMERLGAELLLLCSNVATATADDDELVAAQLAELADRAAARGIRIAYEALAWGRFVRDYRHAWRIVQLADRPNLGLCLDSFHILSLGLDPAPIEEIDGDRIFFLQLADAPEMELDVLSWSRHHRLFPGEGSFELPAFLGHVLRAGYRGPLSLEVFNDVFRQTDPVATARHAHRSLRWLADRAAVAGGWEQDRLEPLQPPRGVDFVEIAGEDLSDVDRLLQQLGFDFAGEHRSKRVRLWEAGEARIVLNEQHRGSEARLAGIGLRVDDAAAAVRRAGAIGASEAFRWTLEGEQRLRGVEAPDGTQFFWDDRAGRSWRDEFGGGERGAAGLRGWIDHVNVGAGWEHFDEAVLFATSVLGLTAETSSELPGPQGLVRSQVLRTPDGAVRLACNLAPPSAPEMPRHLAIRVEDAAATARLARARGLEFLPIPSNYYDDLEARFALGPERIGELRELGLLYDRDAHGSFVHFYTPTLGGVFLEIVERRGGYPGYGAANAPVRLAAQRG
ncbi:sugar phosphate isomerase/epimerase and 4-hydroxyphenylpyruvate domain-containing protein [Leucobacter massiliensis]|uniref:3-dehydroshikimate dehydratase n=1 Tax=Leucobacter massiliensis TaxID=1686285 RepID=A0A2S9QNP3_9MICO|nr:sugar phosphate isomerase/epimerase and 4-hydroxyphenylpyruvate domain-containing protein [Leucobacter massiliensis]PRI11213.1 4-hydroxyphenylpyruvate dioxygenase [Leucobacter massiliensis]